MLSDHLLSRLHVVKLSRAGRCDDYCRMATRFDIGLPHWDYSLVQVWRWMIHFSRAVPRVGFRINLSTKEGHSRKFRLIMQTS